MKKSWIFTAGIFTGIGLIASSCGSEKEPDSSKTKLNVLFIAVDDLKPMLGCYGDTIIKTPNFDKLAQNGIRFNHAYCQQAVCNPSRCSLLTGMRPDAIEVYDLKKSYRDKDSTVVTLPQLFKENGYFTAWSGKIFHQGAYDKKSWSLLKDLSHSKEFNSYQLSQFEKLTARIEEASQGKYEADTLLTKIKETGNTWSYLWKHVIYYRVNVSTTKAEVGDYELKDGKIAKAFIDILPDLKAKEKPFFYGLGFKKPHLPFEAPKKYFDMYPLDQMKLPENMKSPINAPSVAMNDYIELREFSDIPNVGPVDSLKALELIQAYYACVSYVDFLLGEALKALEENGLRENTIIVLWGDHGYHLGDHGLWNKHTNFEEATRVPLIFSLPSMEGKGLSSDALVELIDIYPTLADLCGIPVPEDVQGTSIMPLFNDPEMEWGKAAFSQYARSGRTKEMEQVPTSPTVMGYSVRTEKFRYNEWKDIKTGEVFAWELYDYSQDPKENCNVFEDEKYRQQVEELSEMLKKSFE